MGKLGAAKRILSVCQNFLKKLLRQSLNRLEYCSVGNYIRRNFLDCNNPGGSYPGWEFSLVGVFLVGTIRGESSGWKFSGWEFS